MRRHALLALCCLGIMIGTLLAGLWRYVVSGFLERVPPIVRFLEAPQGIGVAAATYVLQVADEDQGLDEARVVIEQRGKTFPVYQQALRGSQNETLTLSLQGKDLGLVDGSARLVVKAFDKSFWNNSAERSIDVWVDYRSPKISVITQQHNVRRGGSQLVVYRAYDDNLAESGVEVEGLRFPGLPASLFDTSLIDNQVFVSLYSVPLDFPEDGTKPRLYAQDSVGNASFQSFPQRILQRAVRVRQRKLSEDEAASLTQTVLFNSTRLAQYYAASDSEKSVPSLETLSPEEQIKIFGNALLSFDRKELRSLGARQPKTKLLGNVLSSPGGTLTSRFGDRVEVLLGELPLFEFSQEFFPLRLPQTGSAIASSAPGQVVFAESLGSFGKIVVLAHGLGISTVYGNLSEILVKQDAFVQTGTAIGRAGSGLLVRKDEALFGVLLHGNFVDPTEWLDRGWTYGHIDEKLKTARGLLGVE